MEHIYKECLYKVKLCSNSSLAQEELNYLCKGIKPTKKTKIFSKILLDQEYFYYLVKIFNIPEKAIFSSKSTLDQEELNYLSKLINPTKKEKRKHYKPELWREINGRIGKARFNSLRILLD